MRGLILILCAFLLRQSLVAQKPTFAWQKQTAKVEYNPTFFGKHTLEELTAETPWRLGSDKATILRTTMPIVMGEAVLPPGAYPLVMKRTGYQTATIQVKGSAKGLNTTVDVEISGAISKRTKSTNQLLIGFQADGKPVGGAQEARMVVQFGDHEWQAPVMFPGSGSMPYKDWTFTVFALPLTVYAWRDKAPVTIATFKKGRDAWNILVGKDSVTLVPIPTIDGPNAVEATVDKASILQGTTRKAPRGAGPDGAPFEISSVLQCVATGTIEEVGPGRQPVSIYIELVCGDDLLHVEFLDPKPRKD